MTMTVTYGYDMALDYRGRAYRPLVSEVPVPRRGPDASSKSNARTVIGFLPCAFFFSISPSRSSTFLLTSPAPSSFGFADVRPGREHTVISDTAIPCYAAGDGRRGTGTPSSTRSTLSSSARSQSISERVRGLRACEPAEGSGAVPWRCGPSGVRLSLRCVRRMPMTSPAAPAPGVGLRGSHMATRRAFRFPFYPGCVFAWRPDGRSTS